jgi:hypothetical protein
MSSNVWPQTWILTLLRSVFLFMLCACGTTTLGQAPFTQETLSKTDLREAIFRYMFEHYNNYGPDVELFCIQPETPQPAEFLHRFAENKPRVVWNSDCGIAGPMNGVREKKTGQRGLRMIVSSIVLVGGREAEAKVGAFSDGIAANWNILHLARENGRWIVKRDALIGVS